MINNLSIRKPYLKLFYFDTSYNAGQNTVLVEIRSLPAFITLTSTYSASPFTLGIIEIIKLFPPFLFVIFN